MFIYVCLYYTNWIHGDEIETKILIFRQLTPFSSPDGSMYAVGGYDSSSHLATVEKYDPQVNSDS